MKNYFEIIMVLVICLILLVVGSCHVIADYNFCSKHFHDEKWSCIFSDKYKYDGEK